MPTAREQSLIHRLAFIKAKGGWCPATDKCPDLCPGKNIGAVAAWDKRFECWLQHVEKLADTSFHTQEPTVHGMRCAECVNLHSIACSSCGWDKELWEEQE